jgi:hypothetical protein
LLRTNEWELSHILHFTFFSTFCAGGFQWQDFRGGGQAWSVEDIMSHFFGGQAAGGFGSNMFTSAAFMMDTPLRLTFMVRGEMHSMTLARGEDQLGSCCS